MAQRCLDTIKCYNCGEDIPHKNTIVPCDICGNPVCHYCANVEDCDIFLENRLNVEYLHFTYP